MPSTRTAPAAVRLDTPVKFLKGIGERRAEQLERLGIRTARDLLWHLPHRYIDASTVTPLARAEVGQEVACIGRVVAKASSPPAAASGSSTRSCATTAACSSASGPDRPFLDRTHRGRADAAGLRAGALLPWPPDGAPRIRHPGRRRRRGRPARRRQGAAGLSGDRGAEPQNHPRRSSTVISTRSSRSREDVLPERPPAVARLPSLAEALRAVHRPATADEAERGRRRLAFDELLDLQLMLIRARAVAKRSRSGVAFTVRRDLTTRLRESLPWELTDDQQRALREITADMTAPERMHRLLMGDVGTGKTVVALFAMLLAVENDFQAALMAPTELLAEQHARDARASARAARSSGRSCCSAGRRRRRRRQCAGVSPRARRGWWSAPTRSCRRACRSTGWASWSSTSSTASASSSGPR